MGNQSSIPMDNLVVLLQLEDNKKILDHIEKQIKAKQLKIDEPINAMGDTILHYAAYKENKQIIEYLKKENASLTVQNNRNLTPYDVCENDEFRNQYLK